MGQTIAKSEFDYEAIDKDVWNKLVNLAGQFNNKMRSYKKSWMELGQIVFDAHDLLAGDGREGKFGPWIESYLNVSRNTAYRYMWAWERFGKCNSVEHFRTEALYELAGPHTPEKAVKEAIKLADKGEKITKAVSGELIEKHTVESKPKQSKTKVEVIDPIEAACDHDFDDEACRKCHAPKPETVDPEVTSSDDDPVDSKELFKRCLEHMRLALKVMEELKLVLPSKHFQAAFDSMDIAHQEVKEWQRSAKSRR